MTKSCSDGYHETDKAENNELFNRSTRASQADLDAHQSNETT